jgi:hypothetical protein
MVAAVPARLSHAFEPDPSTVELAQHATKSIELGDESGNSSNGGR